MERLKKTVCVDLDGVLADWSQGWRGVEHFGEPIRGAQDFLRDLRQVARVVIFSCRGNAALGGRDGRKPEELAQLMQDWLDRHGLVHDEVYVGQGKPVAAAYIDDRAVSCRPEDFDEPQTAFAMALCDVHNLLS